MSDPSLPAVYTVDLDGPALRDPWTDVPDADLIAVYGWTEAAIAQAHRSAYVLRAGVPSATYPRHLDDYAGPLGPNVPAAGATFGPEPGVDAAIRRMARFWAWTALERGDVGREGAERFYALTVEALRLQVFSPNSPAWYNAGLWHAYGIERSHTARHYRIDYTAATSVVADETRAGRPLHACYIQSLADDLAGAGGIFDLGLREAAVYRSGGGSGTDYSALRGRGEPLSGGGTSSGLLSFLRVHDQGGGAVQSGGTTRRAAKMAVLDVDHPDVEDFVDTKPEAEEIAEALALGSAALAELGEATYLRPLSLRWNASGANAYGLAPYQNANHSLRIDGASFWAAYDADGEIELRPRTGGAGRRVRVRDLVDRIARAAWRSGDPGVQWDDLIQAAHTVPSLGRIRASNPCSEYLFLDDTACNLAAVRVSAFAGHALPRMLEQVRQAAHLIAWILDLTIDAAAYPSQRIAEQTARTRTIGAGLMDLAGALMVRGLRYSSAEGRELAAQIQAEIANGAALRSVELAELWGAFPAFAADRDRALAVLGAQITDPAIRERAERAGYRNAQITVIAPTGTTGLVAGCDATGAEPLTSRKSWVKHYADGRTERFAPRCVLAAEAAGHADAIEDVGSLTPEDHLLMVAALQPHVSGAISKTVNLPASATPEDVARIFRRSWELGIKAVSIYRDGAKRSQPLGGGDPDAVTRARLDRLRRPTRRDDLGELQATRVKARIGGRSTYLTLARGEDGAPLQLRVEAGPAGTPEAALYEGVSRIASLALRAGVPLAEIAETLEACASPSEAGPVVRPVRGVRWAQGPLNLWGRYLLALDGAPASSDAAPTEDAGGGRGRCARCGEEALERTGTCQTCRACGHSTGGCG